MKNTYLDVTQEQGKEFFQRQIEGEITMLNLLRFREVADYSAHPELAPDQPISGEHAYQLYMQYTWPFLIQAGGEVTFLGKSGNFLIGPTDEKWDMVLLVRHASLEKFMAFASHEDYLKIAGHRTACGGR